MRLDRDEPQPSTFGVNCFGPRVLFPRILAVRLGLLVRNGHSVSPHDKPTRCISHQTLKAAGIHVRRGQTWNER